MKTLFSALVGACMLGSVAQAATITYESRAWDRTLDKTDYEQSWLDQTSSVHSLNLDQFHNVRAYGSNRDRFSHLSFSFDISPEKSGRDWLFQFAADAGFGGAAYLNGSEVSKNTTDLWWGRNWNRTSELLTASISNAGAGSYDFDVYWAEGCCNGWQSARFSLDDGQSWQTLSVDNLQVAGVPEPGSLALIALGAAGLIAARKVTNKA